MTSIIPCVVGGNSVIEIWWTILESHLPRPLPFFSFILIVHLCGWLHIRISYEFSYCIHEMSIMGHFRGKDKTRHSCAPQNDFLRGRDMGLFCLTLAVSFFCSIFLWNKCPFRAWLCKWKCHQLLHQNVILSVLWPLVSIDFPEECEIEGMSCIAGKNGDWRLFFHLLCCRAWKKRT